MSTGLFLFVLLVVLVLAIHEANVTNGASVSDVIELKRKGPPTRNMARLEGTGPSHGTRRPAPGCKGNPIPKGAVASLAIAMKTMAFILANIMLFALGVSSATSGPCGIDRQSLQDPRGQGRGFWPDRRCSQRHPIGRESVGPTPADQHHATTD